MGMFLATFSKPAQSPATLLAKLQAQGLIVHDHKLAFQYLNFVGHYRLKGYWYQLVDPVSKCFKPGVSFEMIRDRYEFDREIRAMILEAAERLEVAVRGAICNYLSLKHSPHWYLDPHLFKPVREFGMGQMLSKIESEVRRSGDKHFIDAYFKKYDDPLSSTQLGNERVRHPRYVVSDVQDTSRSWRQKGNRGQVRHVAGRSVRKLVAYALSTAQYGRTP